MITLLLKHGANIEQVDDTGKTPLIIACELQHLKVDLFEGLGMQILIVYVCVCMYVCMYSFR